MASTELINYVENLKQVIAGGKMDDEVVDALYQSAQLAFKNDYDTEYALEITDLAKKVIEEIVLRQTDADIWALEAYAIKNEQNFEILQNYYNILRLEAPYLFESFIFYMEKKRPQEKRFYLPRKKTLKVVVNDLQDLEDRKIKFYGLSMPSRVGKALAYDTPVLTNHGWKKHGELTILDRVIGLDGDFHRILAIHNPCQMEYKVTFSDGEEIICHGNHEWRVKKRGCDELMDIETKILAEKTHEKDGHSIYTIPEKEVFEGLHQALWVTPYALGAWLGDGRNQNPDICGAETDYAIVQKILDDGYELAWNTKHTTTGVRYYGFRGLREGLQKYGMCHSRRRVPKYIPSDYLIADIEQRLELLAGLLDTDGSLAKEEGRYRFTTNEESLRDGFVSLVNTFGWRTSVTRCEKGMSSSGIYANKPYWVISFNPTMHIPCQLERKKLYEFTSHRSVTIKSIEKIDGYVGGNCITVDGGIYCVGKTLKPTHNSTTCIFFLAWICLKRPNSHNAMGGHSGILAKGFYKELLNLIDTEEYTFYEMFADYHPHSKSFLTDKSAEEFTITLDKPDRFATVTCRGIDGTWTGAVDISRDGYLYVDDLVRDREHSLSPTRMENTFQEYLNKMVDRKNDGARELMVGTLWNVLDPLERIRKLNEDNPAFRFRKIPALNENDESNFDYDFDMGFSTEYYQEMRERLDKAEWMAKYQQQPFVREGLLFESDHLRYFNGILPDGDHRIVAVVDVALGGGDSLSMPIGAQYENGDIYIFDWVHSKGTKETTLPIVTGRIIGNNITEIRFEANQGGDLYCGYVDEMLIEQGYKCSCTHKRAPNTMEKTSKILAHSGNIQRQFIFLESKKPTKEQLQTDAELGIKRYVRSQEYQKAMDELTSYVTIGKNEHDDAVDALTQLDIFVEGDETAEVKAMMNPFRGYWR